MAEGWICPRCGRGLAPWVFECPCYKEQGWSSPSSQTTMPEASEAAFIVCPLCGESYDPLVGHQCTHGGNDGTATKG